MAVLWFKNTALAFFWYRLRIKSVFSFLCLLVPKIFNFLFPIVFFVIQLFCKVLFLNFDSWSRSLIYESANLLHRFDNIHSWLRTPIKYFDDTSHPCIDLASVHVYSCLQKSHLEAFRIFTKQIWLRM